MIAQVIQRYYPDWEPPPDLKVWNKTCCPFHGEENPSAAVSYELQGFNCMACSVRGDVISIIRHEEEVSFAEAKRIAAELSVGGDAPVQGKPSRKSRPRLFGESRAVPARTLRSGIRGRSSPWS